MAGSSLEKNDRDLGFGNVVAAHGERLLNRDGSFNVHKEGLGFWSSLSPYHALLELSWHRFFVLLACSYFVINAVFAIAFLLCGPGALDGGDGDLGEGFTARFGQAFFFSVQTLATIGYGRISPVGWWANLLVTLESMIGIFLVTLGTGLFFARFSQPSAKVRFSRHALIAPFGQGQAFEFRVINLRKSQLIEVEAKVILALFEEVDGQKKRRFHRLGLERDRVTFFPLSWTIVHPIDETSPLVALGEAELDAREAEFLVLLSGVDEASGQVVHSRTSYTASEIVTGARFVSMFDGSGSRAHLSINANQLDQFERLS
jgi:inward rectifier potassium channel